MPVVVVALTKTLRKINGTFTPARNVDKFTEAGIPIKNLWKRKLAGDKRNMLCGINILKYPALNLCIS